MQRAVQRPRSRRYDHGYLGRMAIIPDSKNWTWVLDETCRECGFDAGAVDVSFTVESHARYFLHDPVHHLSDVATGNAMLAATGE